MMKLLGNSARFFTLALKLFLPTHFSLRLRILQTSPHTLAGGGIVTIISLFIQPTSQHKCVFSIIAILMDGLYWCTKHLICRAHSCFIVSFVSYAPTQLDRACYAATTYLRCEGPRQESPFPL